MILIVARENPDPVNNLNNIVKALDARKIPYILTQSRDPKIIKRTDIQGIIIPGTNHVRIIPYEIQPELE